MNVVRASGRYQIYPARYFSISPTYEIWTKLSIADVHGLGQKPGFEGQNIYFHLNHPIKFVYLVAPVVAIEDVHPKTTLITLDDSSGSSIDIRIERKVASRVVAGASNTVVGNLDVNSGLGGFEVRVDGALIDVATVVKAKCTISSYRGVRQLDLKRISVIKDTNEEVAAWRAQTDFKREVLARPWTLTSAERSAFDTQKLEEETAARNQARKDQVKRHAHHERTLQRDEKRRLHEERTEQRRKAAEERLNKGAIF
ncbi:hypothetical protein MBLNU459_g0393t1 [Dothideomycetes sp. NU459]